ncbi:hypothetical protein MKK75_12880 [Methylobacterium sp. J-030]|uniref:hypothetical protein n=1 Tax=Methylobacterium sp. J-030 TaxID=2836627 RepID=UPI001FBA13F7|nr:hypothetical protein [Methylobacterium sp. J-030]MCJ2069672.1 hypothetical protein [Methylobacterium sp. J-030]
MTHPRILCPPAGALACFNCSAWSDFGDIGVADERNGRLVHVGRKPTGECRANPPARDPEAIGSTSAVWPVVTATDWCRQFEPTRADNRGEAA